MRLGRLLIILARKENVFVAIKINTKNYNEMIQFSISNKRFSILLKNFSICFILLFSIFNLKLNAQKEIEKQIQTQLILAENGTVIELPAGRFEFFGTLSLDEKSDITIRGAGQGKTVLSFKNQTSGAEGLKVTNSQNIVLQDFTIENAKGDLIKTQKVNGIIYKNITAQWTGKPKKTNGSYALYPVECRNVVIENCTAIGASDAGIYVGQSDSAWVKGCTAINNVAGIEIENTTNAWVFDNLATKNTGGILVFDLPNLPKIRGGNIHVYNNRVIENNYKNFAPKGNIVAKVPPGTGVMIMATNRVQVSDNLILKNKTASVALVSFYIAETPFNSPGYYPYPSAIEIYNNQFSTGKRMPTLKNKLGVLFFFKFGRKVPHILYDGIKNTDNLLNNNALSKSEDKICIYNNQNGTFANFKADKKFKGISKDLTPYECVLKI